MTTEEAKTIPFRLIHYSITALDDDVCPHPHSHPHPHLRSLSLISLFYNIFLLIKKYCKKDDKEGVSSVEGIGRGA